MGGLVLAIVLNFLTLWLNPTQAILLSPPSRPPHPAHSYPAHTCPHSSATSYYVRFPLPALLNASNTTFYYQDYFTTTRCSRAGTYWGLGALTPCSRFESGGVRQALRWRYYACSTTIIIPRKPLGRVAKAGPWAVKKTEEFNKTRSVSRINLL